MTDKTEEMELKDRLSLIESMIAEGRRTTESWGWTFVLWGVAYYVAIAWATWGIYRSFAWPVTMTAASVMTGVIASRKARYLPATTLGRAMSSIWISMGISMFIVLMSLATSGRYDLHVFVAIIGAMMGMANATSSMILKWKIQSACALVWGAVAVMACFTSDNLTWIAFLTAIFFCQIVFGIYAMICESRRRNQEANHA
jgi:hypothetical protein